MVVPKGGVTTHGTRMSQSETEVCLFNFIVIFYTFLEHRLGQWHEMIKAFKDCRAKLATDLQ